MVARATSVVSLVGEIQDGAAAVAVADGSSVAGLRGPDHREFGTVWSS